MLLILGGALAAGFLVLQSGKRVTAIEISAPIGAGQQIPLSSMQQVQIAADSGLDYVPWDEAGQVSRFFTVSAIPAGTLLTRGMVAATGVSVTGKAVLGLALKDGQLPRGLQDGDHVAIFQVSDAQETCPGGSGGLLTADALVLAIGTPAATSGSQAQADVEVAVNPADAGAVACNAANGIAGLAVLPGGGGGAGLAPARGQTRHVTHSRAPAPVPARRRPAPGPAEMALIAVAADKGAPGVTTTATALAAVWPRPVVLAECDPAGGDIVYRLPGAHGGRLDPRRGLLSLAVAARHGLEPGQVWQHAQRLRGGLDVLAGVGNAEQGSGIEPLWGPVGDLLARLPGADVIADCGRLGPDGPYYELLARAAIVVLIIRPSLGEVLRLRDRVAAVALAVGRRGGREAQHRRPGGRRPSRVPPRAGRGTPGGGRREQPGRPGRRDRLRAEERAAAARRVGRPAGPVPADPDRPGRRRPAGRRLAAQRPAVQYRAGARWAERGCWGGWCWVAGRWPGVGRWAGGRGAVSAGARPAGAGRGSGRGPLVQRGPRARPGPRLWPGSTAMGGTQTPGLRRRGPGHPEPGSRPPGPTGGRLPRHARGSRPRTGPPAGAATAALGPPLGHRPPPARGCHRAAGLGPGTAPPPGGRPAPAALARPGLAGPTAGPDRGPDLGSPGPTRARRWAGPAGPGPEVTWAGPAGPGPELTGRARLAPARAGRGPGDRGPDGGGPADRGGTHRGPGRRGPARPGRGGGRLAGRCGGRLAGRAIRPAAARFGAAGPPAGRVPRRYRARRGPGRRPRGGPGAARGRAGPT